MIEQTLKHSTTSHTSGLLEPVWADIVSITPEAEGISTFWIRFTDPVGDEPLRIGLSASVVVNLQTGGQGAAAAAERK